MNLRRGLDYPAALRILEAIPSRTVKPGLQRISALLKAIGSPERTVPVIHVVGTNGKGSVAAMLDRVLREAGYRVGLYSSPHLSDVRERVRVQGACISQDDLCRHVGVLDGAMRVLPDPPSYFELLTAMAFRHFSECAVDVAVLEAGMGGRWDATHQGTPLCCVLTGVALDHTEFLGPTLADIAREKAGIATAGVPFVAGVLTPEAKNAAQQECSARGGRWISTEGIDAAAIRERWDGTQFRIESPAYAGLVDLSLPGLWQQGNLCTVLGAVDSLRSIGLDIEKSHLIAGLRNVRWPGRFESVHRAPRIVLDGAHNPSAISAICGGLQRLVPQSERRHVLFGAMADKAVPEMLKILLPVVSCITTTSSGDPRAMSARELAEATSRLGVRAKISDTVADGVAMASASLGSGDVLLVTGSLAVVGQARVEWVEAGCGKI